MKRAIWLLLLLPITPAITNASMLIAICKNFQGTRIEYFKSNLRKEPNHEFILNKDSLSAQVQLTWDTNKNSGQFVLQYQRDNEIEHAQIALLLHDTNHEQLTFVGISNGAPFLFTLYPEEKVAIYSWHTTQSFLDDGIKAIDLYAKCDMSIK